MGQSVTSQLALSYHLVGWGRCSGADRDSMFDAVQERFERVREAGRLLSPERQPGPYSGLMITELAYHAGLSRYIFLSYGKPCPYYKAALIEVAGDQALFGFGFETETLVAQGALAFADDLTGENGVVARAVAAVLRRHKLSPGSVNLIHSNSAIRSEVMDAAQRIIDERAHRGEAALRLLAQAGPDGPAELWVEGELHLHQAVVAIRSGVVEPMR